MLFPFVKFRAQPPAPPSALRELRVDTFFSNGTWTCPAGVTSVSVECWGAGGGGTTNTAGGGGGAYSKKTVAVTPSSNYAVVVGTSAANANGGDTTFASTTVVAKGGLSGGNGRTGGQASAGTGDTKYSGGDGGNTSQGAGGAGAGDSGDGSAIIGDQRNRALPGQTNGGVGTKNNGSAGNRGGGGGSSTSAQYAGLGGELRITYSYELTSGFPCVLNRTWGNQRTNTSTHPVSIPSGGSVGNLLLAIFGCSREAAGIPTCSIDGGWTKLGQLNNGGGSVQAVFYKISTGSDTANITTDIAVVSSYICLRINNAGTPEATIAQGYNSTPDSPNHTPSGGSKNYLWISALQIGENNTYINSIPTNFYNGVYAPNGAINSYYDQKGDVFTCEYRYAGASLNPGAYSTTSVRWVASTISIPPA